MWTEFVPLQALSASGPHAPVCARICGNGLPVGTELIGAWVVVSIVCSQVSRTDTAVARCATEVPCRRGLDSPAARAGVCGCVSADVRRGRLQRCRSLRASGSCCAPCQLVSLRLFCVCMRHVHAPVSRHVAGGVDCAPCRNFTVLKLHPCPPLLLRWIV